jgi:hypothetical protein
MKYLVVLWVLFASFVNAQSCLALRHYEQPQPQWPDEVERSHGFYWVDVNNRCGRDLGRLYVVISFWDANNERLTGTFWALDIDRGQHGINRFTAPPMDRPYRNIRVEHITGDLMEAICLTDKTRCEEWKKPPVAEVAARAMR